MQACISLVLQSFSCRTGKGRSSFRQRLPAEIVQDLNQKARLEDHPDRPEQGKDQQGSSGPEAQVDFSVDHQSNGEMG